MLQQAIQKFRELGKREDVGITYVHLAKVQFGLGDVDEAENSCRVARNLLPEMHLDQGWIHRLLGQIEWQRQNREEATWRFQAAADCFSHHGKVGEWAETMADVSRLKLEANDPDTAIQIMFEVRSQTQQSLSERGILL